MAKRQLTKEGIEVKKALLDMGLTQTEFCKKYGIPRTRFCDHLYGVRPRPKYSNLIKEVLKVKVSN